MTLECLPLSLAILLAKHDIIESESESESKSTVASAWQNASMGSLFKSSINVLLCIFLDAIP